MKCYVRDSLANMIKRDVTESTTASDVDANVIIIIIIIIIIISIDVMLFTFSRAGLVFRQFHGRK